jgi:hypothetical protein
MDGGGGGGGWEGGGGGRLRARSVVMAAVVYATPGASVGRFMGGVDDIGGVVHPCGWTRSVRCAYWWMISGEW